MWMKQSPFKPCALFLDASCCLGWFFSSCFSVLWITLLLQHLTFNCKMICGCKLGVFQQLCWG